jgi:hypothetical protein
LDRLGRTALIPGKPLTLIALAILAGCSSPAPARLGAATGSAAGAHWGVPSTWTAEGPRPMRVATYAIPALAGDGGSAECAVFFFGAGQGGAVDLNLQRWEDQFEAGRRVETSVQRVNGLRVSRLVVTGAYKDPGGPAMESQGTREHVALLGAIVEAPQGLVFFKAIGPERSMAAARGGFDAMVGSLRPE